MTVSPATEQRTTLRIVPSPATTTAPKLHQTHQRQVVAIQSDIIEATTELVYQRDDLKEAASDVDNRALTRALRALDDGDVALARDLIRVALFAADAQDAAAVRADERRASAQHYQRSAAGRTETMLLERSS